VNATRSSMIVNTGNSVPDSAELTANDQRTGYDCHLSHTNVLRHSLL